MNILLTGASGFVGRNLCAALNAAGHRVHPADRRHGIDMTRMLQPADWHPHLENIDAVINTVGIIGQTRRQRFDVLHTQAPIALFRACEQAGVRRVVQVSALGADESALSAFHLSKRAADEALLHMALEGSVVRPALIYGRGGTSAALFLRLAALPRIPVLEDGQQQLQPVHISDVVATILCALSVTPVTRVIDVVGPDTLSFADWMQTLRTAQGLPPGRLLQVPYRLALAACHLGRATHPLAEPANLRMLRRGCTADGRIVQNLLGRPLRRPEPGLQFEDASILWRHA